MKLDITTLFDSALIMFIPVLAGIAAARLGYFKDGFSKKLSAFVLNIAQPFMLAGLGHLHMLGQGFVFFSGQRAGQRQHQQGQQQR